MIYHNSQILVRQSTTKEPTRGVDRFVESGWWWTAVIITVSYTGNLIAVLTVPVFPAEIGSVQQLAKSFYR